MSTSKLVITTSTLVGFIVLSSLLLVGKGGNTYACTSSHEDICQEKLYNPLLDFDGGITY
jgi:hypothetical protein